MKNLSKRPKEWHFREENGEKSAAFVASTDTPARLEVERRNACNRDGISLMTRAEAHSGREWELIENEKGSPSEERMEAPIQARKDTKKSDSGMLKNMSLSL